MHRMLQTSRECQRDVEAVCVEEQMSWLVGSLPGIGYCQIRPLVVKGCPHEAVSQVPGWLDPCCLQKLEGAAPADSLPQTMDSLPLNDIWAVLIRLARGPPLVKQKGCRLDISQFLQFDAPPHGSR